MSFDIQDKMQDFMVLCRVCEGTKNLLDLTKIEYRHLNDKLNRISDFKVKYNCLLRHICIPCSLKLEETLMFINQCEKTYQKLVTLLDSRFLHDPSAADHLKITDPAESLDITIKEEEYVYPDTIVVKKSNSESEDNEEFSNANEQELPTSWKIPQMEDEEAVSGPLPTELDAESEMLDKFDTFFAMEDTNINGKIIKKGDKLFVCRLCPKIYAVKAYLVRHIHKKHENEDFKCLHCSTICKTSFELNFHLEVSHKIDDPSNEHYSKNTARHDAQMEEKQKIHSNQYKFISGPNPTKAKENAEKKKRTLEKVKKEGKQVFTCGICKKELKWKNALKVHIESTHLKLKRFECGICNKKFYHKSSFQLHERIHEDSNIDRRSEKYEHFEIISFN
ncbi:zinc finger and BTB domain-containing protein 41-like isoform X2 [Lutzomyia longipalpis]|uniref:zinc finger and BTB domain-containing protein 41-like isoform X2 n=1 Tax=Lutzomyia longipalpis TaxID=7200 RepID=UPI0024841093|nr:zinc finger and BTB domain-containing protein 41-like isoform X2 [Lutzomyia longipalpis]